MEECMAKLMSKSELIQKIA
jgi:DNA-binding protein HU-beta